MNPNNMSALMTALKNKEVPPALSEHDPAVVPGDDAPEGDQSDDSSPEMNQKIVDVLQSQYPRIYEKIFAMVGDNDDGDPSDQGEEDESADASSPPVPAKG